MFGATYYYATRTMGFGAACGASVNVMNHIGGAVFLGGSEASDGGLGGGGVGLEVVEGNTQYPTPVILTGTRLILPANIPMQCGAGTGYPACEAGSFHGPLFYDGVEHGDGCFFSFKAGLCTFAFGNGAIPAPITGGFPTADGRVAAVVEGYIVSVT